MDSLYEDPQHSKVEEFIHPASHKFQKWGEKDILRRHGIGQGSGNSVESQFFISLNYSLDV